MRDQKKAGVMIQYGNILLNMAISIFFTPFLIRSLGESEYGLYRIVQAFAGQLGIMSFGIGILVTRNIVRFDTLKQPKEKANFLAMSAGITVLLSCLVVVVGWILSFSIDALFDQSLTAEEIALARKLYWFLIANVAMTVMGDFTGGIVSGHEKFVVRNGVVTLRYVLRIGSLILLLKLGFGAVAIVATDLALTVLIFLINLIYGRFCLKERLHFTHLDKKELITALTFSFAILLQAIVNQVNQNLDSIILGAMTDTSTVTMYSVALNLFTMFNSITLVIGTVFTPQATKLVIKDAPADKLTDFVIRPGRLQFMMGSMIITGFVVYGQEFIRFWVGSSFAPAYTVAIILMVPALIPLVQNVTGAILDAMMKRLGKSLILVAMAAVNVGVSIVLVRFFGYIGAAWGTALSLIVGNMLLMNIYLHRVTKLQLKRMYGEIVSGSWLIAILCSVFFYALNTLLPSDRLIFLLVKMAVYVLVYMAGMYFFAMRDSEKKLILAPIRRVKRLLHR